MKIVKKITVPTKVSGTQTFGLGDDGKLYQWHAWNLDGTHEWLDSERKPAYLSLQSMQLIVEAFAHLVVFT